MTRLGAARAIGAALALSTSACASVPRPEVRPSDLPTRDIDLAAWGLTDVDALRFAELGVLEQEPRALVVYHLGASDPLPAPRPGAHAPPGGAVVRVIDTQSGNRNHVGGFFNGFAKAPATAQVGLDGEALDFRYDKRAGTFAGFWVHLFDSLAPVSERVYLDARALRWLTFEVRGERGDEPIRIQIADQDRERGEGSLPLSDLSRALPAGRVTTTWQRAWVALDALDAMAIDLGRLASLVFLVDPDGKGDRSGRVWLRDVALTTTQTLPPAVAPAPVAPARTASEARAMWLWETASVMRSEPEIDALLEFCRAQAFTDLFVQIPFVPERTQASERLDWDAPGYAHLIARLTADGLRIHALDGAAWYARPAWHARVLDLVTRLGAWNRTLPANARLHGLRFDIEPYLLPEWQGAGRGVVLDDYRALLTRIVALAHADGLVLGVDIPFWWDARAERAGDLAAPLDGRPAAEVVIDLVDNIGLMDYRTTTYGADGVLAQGADELAYAADRKKQVFIGLETVPLPDERIALWEAKPRSPYDVTAELVIEPLPGRRARLTWIAPSMRRADYPWLGPESRILRQRSQLLVPASKITFASQGKDALAAVMRESHAALAAYPSFAGFVIHSYESYRRWFDAPAITSQQPASELRQ